MRKNLSFEDNRVRKRFFLSAYFYWGNRLSLRELDEINKFDGTIGFGNSYLEILFRHLKILDILDYKQNYMMML